MATPDIRGSVFHRTRYGYDPTPRKTIDAHAPLADPTQNIGATGTTGGKMLSPSFTSNWESIFKDTALKRAAFGSTGTNARSSTGFTEANGTLGTYPSNNMPNPWTPEDSKVSDTFQAGDHAYTLAETAKNIQEARIPGLTPGRREDQPNWDVMAGGGNPNHAQLWSNPKPLKDAANLGFGWQSSSPNERAAMNTQYNPGKSNPSFSWNSAFDVNDDG